MKKTKFLKLSGGAIMALALPLGIALSSQQMQIFGYNASSSVPYKLTLNESKNLLDFDSDTSSITTAFGNPINFRHSDASYVEGKVANLAVGGYIQNDDMIAGMANITVNFTGSLSIEYSWENNQEMLVKEELLNGVPYNFYDKTPSYFKIVNTGDTPATIDDIEINYYCVPTVKKVVQINYLYKDTQETIASPKYLILDENEIYGKEDNTGKGRLEIGSEIYVPDLFWVGGIADENKVVNVNYTLADVYDKSYDPEEDTSRELLGSGTVEDPYQINTVEDLIWVEYNNHGVNLASSYTLNTSVDLTGYAGWTGICNSNVNNTKAWRWYSGQFYGNGYTVAGLNMSAGVTALSFIANVGEGGSVTNLNLEGSITSSASLLRAGALAYQNKGTVNNINSFVDVTYNATTTDPGYMGGVLGSTVTGTTRNISNYGTINPNAGQYCGGVLGYVSDASSIIENCTNYGTINVNSAKKTGGVIGYMASSTLIQNCVNYGSVNAGNGTDIGGIAGYTTSNAKIKGCVNYGSVFNGASHIGGVIGSTSGSLVDSCANYGTITSRSSENGGTAGISGIVAWVTSSSKVYGCIAGGVVISTDNSTNDAFVCGYIGAGSLVYGLTGEPHTATEDYPANTIVIGSRFNNTTYPTEGQFKVFGQDKNGGATRI